MAREFGAVGERELHGSASGDVEAGIGFIAPCAHCGDNCVLIDGDKRVGEREFGIDVVVGGAVFVARVSAGRMCRIPLGEPKTSTIIPYLQTW